MGGNTLLDRNWSASHDLVSTAAAVLHQKRRFGPFLVQNSLDRGKCIFWQYPFGAVEAGGLVTKDELSKSGLVAGPSNSDIIYICVFMSTIRQRIFLRSASAGLCRRLQPLATEGKPTQAGWAESGVARCRTPAQAGA